MFLKENRKMEEDKKREKERLLIQRGAGKITTLDCRYNGVSLFYGCCIADTSGSEDELTKTITPVPAQKTYFLEYFLPCDPRRFMHRYFMLVLMCFLSFGSYYVYDNPTALQSTIIRVSGTLGEGKSHRFGIVSWYEALTKRSIFPNCCLITHMYSYMW